MIRRRILRVSALSVLCVMVVGDMAIGQQPAALAQEQRAADTAGRARLEENVRRVFARAVRKRVGLSDDQMQRLAPIATRYEKQRRDLQMLERDTRIALRSELTHRDSADGAKVDGLLQRMVDIQKRRVQILESEQHDLAGIMTPVQRARYMALQEQVRRRLEQMRQRRLQMEQQQP